MLLVVDVGNTQTVIGLYPTDETGATNGCDLADHWRISSSAERTPDELAMLFRQFLAVRGDSFDQLEASGLLARAQAQGARVLRLRKLPDALLQKVDALGASFWAAQQPGTLGMLDRQRLKLWLSRTSDEIGALLPAV